MKKKFKIFLLCLVIFVLAFATVIFSYNKMLEPVSDNNQDINFLVNSNDNLTTITNKLEEEDIIKSAFALKIYGKINGVSNFIEGAFTLNKNWEGKKILNYLTDSKNIISNEVTITLQEGLWAKQMAEKISNYVDVNQEELLELWNDSEYIKVLMKDYPFLTQDVLSDILTVKLEGYLAPDTYNFFIDSDADTITRKILDQTLKIYNKYIDGFTKSQYNIHEIFALAALTQYEAGNYEDDQIIAGIWYNRLEAGWKLESSAATCYALYEFDTWQECERNINYDSPYNTYMYPGIPPGPVTNPGELSIKATLYPEKTDYFFFLADAYGDGTIYYSETFEEHSIKVNKYLR